MGRWIVFLGIGLFGGVSAGLFGVGGGLVIVPGLIYFAGFTQHRATGTSLAVLLPPVGLAATIEYYRNGNVDLSAAMVVATTMFVGSWVGAYFANHMDGAKLRLLFGVFVTTVGFYLIYGAGRRLGWI